MTLWTLDPSHTSVEFAVKHMGFTTVRGNFTVFGGSAETNDKGQLVKIDATADVSSISTKDPQRDGHLKSADFFDAGTHPTLAFKSTKIEHAGSELVVTGDLTIRGETKSVTLKGEAQQPQKDPWGNQRAAIALEGKISRKEFGLTWNVALEAGGFLVSDDVKITIEAQAVQAAAAAA